MRLLGVDFGGKRIGLAVAETDPEVVSPRSAISASGTLKKDAIAIAAIAKQEQTDAIVVGIPESAHGQSKMAGVCQKLIVEIRAQGYATHSVDEAFTSMESAVALRDHGWTAATRRKHIDSESACRILERFIDVQIS